MWFPEGTQMSTLKKTNFTRIGALVIGLAGLLATSAAVANGGWGSGGDRFGHDYKQDEPRFKVFGDQLSAMTTIRNLDHRREVKVELIGRAKAEIECGQRGRGHGWGAGGGRTIGKSVYLDLYGIERYSRHELRGNTLYVDIETDRLYDEIDKYWGGYGCGRDWDRRIKNVGFESATLTVYQSGRTLVQWECDFDYLIRSGNVPRRAVDCRLHY
jgi:hypothetical protein